MDNEAVLEAPELDAPVLDAPVEEQEVVDDPVETQAEPEGEDLDWRNVPPSLREFFKTPEGYKAREAWHERKNFKERFPDGIKQADRLLSFLEEHGGQEALGQKVTEMVAASERLQAIERDIAEGNESVLEKIPAESLAKLAPVVAQKWMQADPEGWQRNMSSVMAATIQQSGIPMFLERMGMLLEFGKTDEVKAAIGKLSEWSSSFQQVAAQAATAKGPDANVASERQQWEKQKFDTEVGQDLTSFRTSLIEKALESFVARKPNDPEAKDLAVSAVAQKVIERMNADKDLQGKLNALYERKDRDGFLRLIKSREKAAIDEIAPKLGRTIFGQPAAAKPAPVAVKPRTTTTTPAKPVDRFSAIWNEA